MTSTLTSVYSVKRRYDSEAFKRPEVHDWATYLDALRAVVDHAIALDGVLTPVGKNRWRLVHRPPGAAWNRHETLSITEKEARE